MEPPPSLQPLLLISPYPKFSKVSVLVPRLALVQEDMLSNTGELLYTNKKKPFNEQLPPFPYGS